MIKEYRLLTRYQYFFVTTTIAPYLLFVIFLRQSVYGLSGLCFVLPISLFGIFTVKVGNNWELLSFFKQVFIPLYSFSDNWRDAELGQQIKQYAPHLFV